MFKLACAVMAVVAMAAVASGDVLSMPGGYTSLDLVTVGNPGNIADTAYETPGHGGVAYTYDIGTYEVTAGQYVEFLNAVAASDPYGLYHPAMNDHDYGCQITRHGVDGGYTYDFAGRPSGTEADWVNRPVNYVSWGDAARFANWLHNGQLTGAADLTTTEDGAYYLNGATTDAALMAVTRQADWQWAVPTEDEWYKAAYHANDGTTGNYFGYPTGTDDRPSNVLGDPVDPGNNASFYVEDPESFTIGEPYWRTLVGDHENSASPYGTFDQGGNVWEWNETAFDGTSRGLRGGSAFWLERWMCLHAANYIIEEPTSGSWVTGFRVVHVPEPASLSLLALGALAIVRRKR